MKLNKQIVTWGAATALSMAALVPAVAQSATGLSNPNSLGAVAKVNDVYGNEVISSDNQKVGKLNNLVVDLESGRILYGVVNAAKGRVGVPPEIFTSTPGANASDKNLHVNVDKAKIDAAPQFNNSDSAQGIAQAGFIAQVYQYFGQPAWWQGKTAADQGAFNNAHKASELLGMKVEDVNNQRIGKINNVMVDLPAGRIAYVIFAPDSSLNLGDNYYAMPPQALTLSSDHKNLVTGIDKSKLAGAPHFASNSWPNLTDTAFASEVYTYFGKSAWFNNAGAPQPTGR